MQFCSLLLFIVLTTQAFSERNDCPSSEDIYPCRCDYQLSDRVRLECEDETISLNELKSVLSHFLGKKDVVIDLVGLDLRNIQSDFFKGIGVFAMMIKNCKIDKSEDGGPAFSGLEDSLHVLEIDSSLDEKNIPLRLNFRHLKQLYNLDLRHNKIAELNDDWLGEGLPSLTHLSLTNNNIEKLGAKAFEKLTNLDMFTFTKNKFVSFERSMLPMPATNLWSLDLSENGLESLSEDIFSSMPSLDRVLLNGNSIKTLDYTTWEPIFEQLVILELDENPLQCDSEMDWLSTKKIIDTLTGTCQGPREKKGLSLREYIESKQRSGK